jgi:hypothetical protein
VDRRHVAELAVPIDIPAEELHREEDGSQREHSKRARFDFGEVGQRILR